MLAPPGTPSSLRNSFPHLLSVPSEISVSRKTPTKSATSLFASIDGELSTAHHLSSSPLSCNFKLSTINCPPLTPFPATLAGHLQPTENPATLSPLPATLTNHVTPNPFVCHSCRKTPGVGVGTLSNASRLLGRGLLSRRLPRWNISLPHYLLTSPLPAPVLPCPRRPGATHA
jgi:hypothetical protein